MDAQLEKIKKIRERHEKEWFKIKEVVAVGVGMTDNDQVGIVISVADNPDKVQLKIPSKIDDVNIKILKTGEIKAL